MPKARILLAVSVLHCDAILAKAISRTRINLWIPKSDKILLSMLRSSLVIELWPNIDLSLMKNRA